MGMAKKRYSKKGSKIEPAVQTITLYSDVIAAGGSVTNYIDLSQVASLVNRRFYRQGINWAVSGIKVLSRDGFIGTIEVSKLPNTWVMSNAWEKAFRAWQKMNNEALAEAESVRPKFLDFKIYADDQHHADGYAANLLPHARSGVYTAGEWEPSKIVVPITSPAGAVVPGQVAERELIAVGANYPGAGASGLNAVSLIEGYAASRGLPNVLDPNTPDDALDAGGGTAENWISAMFNEGTNVNTEVLGEMISENNIAPYPFENDGTNVDTMYPGGANQGAALEVHDYEYISGTTIGGTTFLKGGNFPCGLMRFDLDNDGAEADSLRIQIDLVPGNHRGYLCQPMTEM